MPWLLSENISRKIELRAGVKTRDMKGFEASKVNRAIKIFRVIYLANEIHAHETNANWAFANIPLM